VYVYSPHFSPRVIVLEAFIESFLARRSNHDPMDVVDLLLTEERLEKVFDFCSILISILSGSSMVFPMQVQKHFTRHCLEFFLALLQARLEKITPPSPFSPIRTF
jgi:hypothetical protein